VLSEALDRPVYYQPISLFSRREALAGSGLEPYQITHTLSLFSNLNAPHDDNCAVACVPQITGVWRHARWR
jgi:hypothetical protein